MPDAPRRPFYCSAALRSKASRMTAAAAEQLRRAAVRQGWFPIRSTAMRAQEMIATHPDMRGEPASPLVRCIEECYVCAQVCTSCADACLAEPGVEQLRQCIRLDLDCADICLAAGALASRRTGSNPDVLAQLLQACRSACSRCAQECEQHATLHEHCRICGESCRHCERACHDAIQDITSATAH